MCAFGAAALAGVALTGPLLDRFPRATHTVPVATQAAALLGLCAAGSGQVAAVALFMMLGASVPPVFMAAQSQVLRVAPGRIESAPAVNSAAFNVGVAAGSLLGGVLLPVVGVRGAFLAGGLLTAGALGLLIRPDARASSDGVRASVVPAG
ncbi:MFS transporter [Streptomyces sp. NPDC001604]|uniref:MFS transporter n=1 Tax=Streptomyces sp. NPDC001604 TaxID=3364593 RepID=UPI0036C8A260